jgi:TonB family protein
LQKQQAAKDQNRKQECGEIPGVLHMGKDGVSSPELLSKKDPTYTEVARKGKIQGIVILCVVVLHDGAIGNLELLQPIGLGLDESAVEAVKMWRFRPGMKDGNPVDVRATVEVKFELR